MLRRTIMKQAPWKAMVCLSLAACAVLTLSACEDKSMGAAPGDATTASTHSLKGIQIEDVREGTGPVAKKGDTVSVNYLGTLADNGQKFDSSYDRNEPFTFKLGAGQVIQGWDQGIAGMKVGGKRILTISPNKAYGPDGYPPVIPPNATLKFEVELLEVQ
jgi:peptidylprolyl isomerase/FKBP-type peptidyl-prolyl cis-trans isomerase FkpA